jgi:hypothetical protein
VQQSIHRLGRIERLLLHEVRAGDITDELLSYLQTLLQAGDVGQLGVATTNADTLTCLRLAPDLFEVAHLAVGPFDSAVALPAPVTVRVGHGVFGAGGKALRALTDALRSDASRAEHWRTCVAGTRWQGPTGLSDLLLARSCTQGLTDVIVATTKPERLASARDLLTESPAIEERVQVALSDLIASVH